MGCALFTRPRLCQESLNGTTTVLPMGCAAAWSVPSSQSAAESRSWRDQAGRGGMQEGIGRPGARLPGKCLRSGRLLEPAYVSTRDIPPASRHALS